MRGVAGIAQRLEDRRRRAAPGDRDAPGGKVDARLLDAGQLAKRGFDAGDAAAAMDARHRKLDRAPPANDAAAGQQKLLGGGRGWLGLRTTAHRAALEID